MNIERKKYIKDITKIISDFFSLSTPVDLNKLILNLNGTILYDTLELNGMDAMIKKRGESSFEIHLSSFQSDMRKRFSIAHELGHLFLHMGYLIDIEKWNTMDEKISFQRSNRFTPKELEANEFAAILLMPESEFKKKSFEYLGMNDVFDIKAIAECFEVSVEAASLRGKKLGIFSKGGNI